MSLSHAGLDALPCGGPKGSSPAGSGSGVRTAMLLFYRTTGRPRHGPCRGRPARPRARHDPGHDRGHNGAVSDIMIDPDPVLWSAEPESRAGRPLLVLLHGYGADERDLFGLAPHLPEEFVVAAPRAPLAPPWPAPGYSWYPIEGLDSRDPTHVTTAAEALVSWLDAAAPDASQVGLLGFSQGAAIALQAMRLQPARFGFVVNLSGYATPGDLPGDAELAGIRPPVFWGRGTHDDVIPPELVMHTT